jgi:hypothetical protein
MIQASKELHIILSRSLSGRHVLYTRCVTLFCFVKVTSHHHVMMRGEWSMIVLCGLLTKP